MAESTPRKRKAAPSPVDASRSKRGNARQAIPPQAAGTHNWRVLRCAAKDKATRSSQGDNRSPMLKTACDTLELRKEGVVGKARVFFGMFGSRTIADFNGYRQRGDSSRGFAPGTPDRAVMLVCDSVYDELRAALPDVTIPAGSIGENLLVSGPAFRAGMDLAVGTRLRVGDTATIEITEANNPCYRLRCVLCGAGDGVAEVLKVRLMTDGRLGYTTWAKQAEAKYGEKWWEHRDLPLSLEHHPGGRGWLCKVVVEGTVKPGDGCFKV
jgi:hypothetical protein